MTPLKLRIALWCSSAVILAGGLALAVFLKDVHMMNRAGALLASFAALAGLIQVSHELKIAKQRDSSTGSADEIAGLESTPLQVLSQRIKKRATEKSMEEFDTERLHVAVSVIASAAIGELVHGFGDVFVSILMTLIGR